MSFDIIEKTKKRIDKLNPLTKALIRRNNYKFNETTQVFPSLGCDPEFFFQNKDNKIIGAEKILPKEGLVRPSLTPVRPFGLTDLEWAAIKNNKSKFIIDGVACELNPRPDKCRANLANEIASCFRLLKETVWDKAKPVLDKPVVEVSLEEIKSLDEKNRKFGCAPSNNLHNSKAAIKIANPEKYKYRGAGGHIHLGSIEKIVKSKDKIEELVWFLDLLVGNTAVLIDRDPMNVERRKNYGRAGEYRLPPHGLEYRTLSNFWLTAYPLMSLMFGLARYAVEIVQDESINGKNIRKAFQNAGVTSKHLTKAINNNDFDQALVNYLTIENIIVRTSHDNQHFTITESTADYFLHFVYKIKAHGLKYWFKDDPLEHWCKLPDAHGGGIYDYLLTTVKRDMDKGK